MRIIVINRKGINMKELSIIFDLDGTLWDTTEVAYKSANLVAEKYNLPKIEMKTIKNSMGQTREYNARLYFPTIELNEAIKLLEESSKQSRDLLKKGSGVIYPDVEKVLNDLSIKMDLYIVSNSSSPDYINTFRGYLDCDFKDTLAAGSLGLDKANGIKYIIEKNKIQEAIYVGDTEIDKISAAQANIPFIYVDYGFGKVENCKYNINNINELENEILRVIDKHT